MRYTMLRYPGFKSLAVTLSYDDGVRSDERLIGILDEYGLKCTFNINTGLYGVGNRFTEAEAKKIYGKGRHEVAVHGYRHLALSEVTESMAVKDVVADRENLENAFGKIVNGMAYANGAYDDNAVEILKNCGIKYARTTVSTKKFDLPTDWLRMPATCHHSETELNRLVDEFLDYKESSYFWANNPRLFYLWGHSYEFDNEDNWDVIENFAKKIGNRNDVWYATNGEIYDYVKAFEALEYSADGGIIYNPAVTDVYLYYYGKNLLVKSGETVIVKT